MQPLQWLLLVVSFLRFYQYHQAKLDFFVPHIPVPKVGEVVTFSFMKRISRRDNRLFEPKILRIRNDIGLIQNYYRGISIWKVPVEWLPPTCPHLCRTLKNVRTFPASPRDYGESKWGRSSAAVSRRMRGTRIMSFLQLIGMLHILARIYWLYIYMLVFWENMRSAETLSLLIDVFSHLVFLATITFLYHRLAVLSPGL